MTKLTLVLARGPGKPEGDLHDRLVLSLALTPGGQIDAEAYFLAAEPWLAFREQDGGEPRPLEVIRLDEGWALQSTNSEDDPLWALDGNVFRPGEVVCLRRPDREEYLFRIVAAGQE